MSSFLCKRVLDNFVHLINVVMNHVLLPFTV